MFIHRLKHPILRRSVLVASLATLSTAGLADDTFNFSEYLPPESEAAVEEAFAAAYGALGRAQQRIKQFDGSYLTVETSDIYQIGCGQATVDVGGTTIAPDSDTPHEVASTAVVLGSITALNVCN